MGRMRQTPIGSKKLNFEDWSYIKDNVQKAWETYVIAMHPFNIDTLALTAEVVGDEAWDAIVTLNAEHKGFIDAYDCSCFMGGMGTDYNSRRSYDNVRLEYHQGYAMSSTGKKSKQYVLPRLEYTEMSLRPDTATKLMNWTLRLAAFDLLHSELSARMSVMTEVVNTVGQLQRLWPVMVNFVREDKVEAIHNAKVRSPLPQWFPRYGNVEAFTSGAFTMLDTMLTTSTMMDVLEYSERTLYPSLYWPGDLARKERWLKRNLPNFTHNY